VQCKFTRKADKTVTLASLSDELDNARSSAKQGLADSYLLFTNSTLTGTTPPALTARTFVDMGWGVCLCIGASLGIGYAMQLQSIGPGLGFLVAGAGWEIGQTKTECTSQTRERGRRMIHRQQRPLQSRRLDRTGRDHRANGLQCCWLGRDLLPVENAQKPAARGGERGFKRGSPRLGGVGALMQPLDSGPMRSVARR
jgi:hypothetical protein